MPTPHEAAVAHLKTLDRAEHPEIEEVLAVARMYPVEVQEACAYAIKRAGHADLIEPIKAVADRQAVELQELLDALTTTPTRMQNSLLREQLSTEEPARRTMKPISSVPATDPVHLGIPVDEEIRKRDESLGVEPRVAAAFGDPHPA